VNEALKKYPDVKVVQTIDDRGDPRIANEQISALLQAKAKFDGIICLEASGGSGAADALHRLNVSAPIPIVAFDNDPETLDWIDRGAITATITQKPCHELLWAEVSGRPAPQRSTPVQRLAHCFGAADAYIRGYWYAGGGQEKSSGVSRRSGCAPQATIELDIPCGALMRLILLLRCAARWCCHSRPEMGVGKFIQPLVPDEGRLLSIPS
jgi:hypothetical protein